MATTRDIGSELDAHGVAADLSHPSDPDLDVGALVDGLIRVAEVVIAAMADGDLSIAELVKIGAAVRAAVIRARRIRPTPRRIA